MYTVSNGQELDKMGNQLSPDQATDENASVKRSKK